MHDYFSLRPAVGNTQLSVEEHLHPSILTLQKDPFKNIPI